MDSVDNPLCEEGGFAYANDLKVPCVNTPIDIEDLSVTGQGNFIITNEIKQAYVTTKKLTLVLTNDDEIDNMGDTYIYPSKVSSSCGYAESSYTNLYIHSYSPDDLIDVGEGIGSFFINIVPGVGYFILAMAIVGGIGLLLRGVFQKVGGKI
jgi:hypothetical protein